MYDDGLESYRAEKVGGRKMLQARLAALPLFVEESIRGAVSSEPVK